MHARPKLNPLEGMEGGRKEKREPKGSLGSSEFKFYPMVKGYTLVQSLIKMYISDVQLFINSSQ